MLKKKKLGFGLEARTFAGNDGCSYLVFRSLDGSYHTYVEVEAKQAARECGAAESGNTRKMWEQLWQVMRMPERPTRTAGQKAAITRKRRAAGRKAAATRKLRKVAGA